MPRFIIEFEVHEKARGTISLTGADEAEVRDQLEWMSTFDLQECLEPIETSLQIDRITPEASWSDIEDRLIADFKRWSGGLPPDECDVGQIDAFVDSSLPDHYRGLEEGIRDFLRTYITP